MRTPLLLLFAAVCLSAQNPQSTSGSLAGVGYRNTSPVIEAAPGQVLIVSLHGAKVLLEGPVAGLPTPPNSLAASVAGFSAQLVQSRTRTPVGLYGVRQSECWTPFPCSTVTNITLQVPFELTATENGLAELEIDEGDAVLARVPLQAVSDKVHVLNACDESLVYYSIFGDPESDKKACTPAVTRPRGGGLITPRNPVRPGERLVAFAYGMGDTDPTPSGQTSDGFRPGLTRQPFILRYSIAGGAAFWAEAPEGVSLISPNGNYQVYFTVPPLPDGATLPGCGQLGLYGNVKVSISGIRSTDTFDLCVSR
jgi:uncharacterized protein (TIGR03437 family)